jgi:glutamate formiminotransferase / 5-formyltetrahydrofolate cyclo-ligase
VNVDVSSGPTDSRGCPPATIDLVAPLDGCPIPSVDQTELACIVNISEGRDHDVIARVAASGGRFVLDVHSDRDHHRTVLTMAGDELEEAVRAVARTTVATIDLRRHRGVHPRLGALDVVPFTPLDGDGHPVVGTGDLDGAIAARDRFAAWAGTTLDLPCFVYGPNRRLPDIRRQAFVEMDPDTGPPSPHPSAGACAVGARFALVAYNLWLSTGDIDMATSIAAAVRGPAVRALGLPTAGVTQVSCNLVDPLSVGPAQIYDEVERLARHAGTFVSRAELVGLVPAAVVEATPRDRWRQLDIDTDKTLEARLERSRSG